MGEENWCGIKDNGRESNIDNSLSEWQLRTDVAATVLTLWRAERALGSSCRRDEYCSATPRPPELFD